MNEKNKNMHISPDLIEKMIAVQEKDLIMRNEELQLQKEIQQQSHANAHEYSLAALQANVNDRQASRKHEENTIRHRYIFSGIILAGLICLIGFALYLNKDQVVMEALKAVLFFGSGGIGGYAYAKKSIKHTED